MSMYSRQSSTVYLIINVAYVVQSKFQVFFYTDSENDPQVQAALQ